MPEIDPMVAALTGQQPQFMPPVLPEPPKAPKSPLRVQQAVPEDAISLAEPPHVVADRIINKHEIHPYADKAAGALGEAAAGVGAGVGMGQVLSKLPGTAMRALGPAGAFITGMGVGPANEAEAAERITPEMRDFLNAQRKTMLDDQQKQRASRGMSIDLRPEQTQAWAAEADRRRKEVEAKTEAETKATKAEESFRNAPAPTGIDPATWKAMDKTQRDAWVGQNAKQGFAAAEAKQKSEQPFREAFPELNKALMPVAWGASAAIPYLNRFTNSRALKPLMPRIDEFLKEGKVAKDLLKGRSLPMNERNALLDTGGGLQKEIAAASGVSPKTVNAAGVFPAIGVTAPNIYDMTMTGDSPARQDAFKQWTSGEIAPRVGSAVAEGYGLSHLFGKHVPPMWPMPRPQEAELSGMLKALAPKRTAPKKK